MQGMKIACGQITWEREYPREKVLEEIAQAGYDGAPAGRYGDSSAADVLAQYARFGLTRKASALESATISRRYLASIGV
jgi:sugar phosphate isomerase/epimerase